MLFEDFLQNRNCLWSGVLDSVCRHLSCQIKNDRSFFLCERTVHLDMIDFSRIQSQPFWKHLVGKDCSAHEDDNVTVFQQVVLGIVVNPQRFECNSELICVDNPVFRFLFKVVSQGFQSGNCWADSVGLVFGDFLQVNVFITVADSFNFHFPIFQFTIFQCFLGYGFVNVLFKGSVVQCNFHCCH